MDTIALPAGATSRAPRLDDAPRILEFVAGYNTRIVGFADYTLDDVRNELIEPGFNLDTDGWLVLDGTGAIVGYGWALGSSDGDMVDVDVVAPDPEVGTWLLDRALGRAREIGRSRGHGRVTIDKGVYRRDEIARALVSARGFAVGTTYHRMRIDHDGPVATPEPPEGVTLRDGTDEAARRAGYEVMTAAFADHFGEVATPYADWAALRESRSTFDWAQLTVLSHNGEPVAVCECTDQFVEDEGCGYVLKIGVLPEARGHGHARYLLRRTFALDAAAGRAGTLLHVDTNNTTPALGLYESVGMRPVMVIDVWRAELLV
ncbi:MAG: GNAT family N-acetyltransferase [Micromonosporaceae bacterium]